MKQFALRSAFAAVAMLVAMATQPAVAQDDMLQSVAEFRDWAVFVDESGPEKYCYIATVPTDTKISQPIRGRGSPFLLIATFPSAGVLNELNMKLGFTARENAPLTLNIDGQIFNMFANGGEAWLENAEADRRAVDAMRRGSRAVITSTSTRGTVLEDSFSLIGFTASLDRMEELCQ